MDGKGDVAVGDEVHGGLSVLIADVDAQERDAVGAGAVVHPLQFWHLDAAGATPLAPDVDHDNLAGEITDGHRSRGIH